jgi:signal transduction histidine kinase
MFIYVDSLSSKRIEDASKFKWVEYQLGKSFTIGYNENSTVWCKLIAEGPNGAQGKLWTFNNFHLDSLKLYYGNKLISVQGDRTAGKSQFLNAYAVSPGKRVGNRSVCIVAVKKQLSFIDFSVSLRYPNELREDTEFSLSLYFSFIGFAILLLAFNAFIFWQIKEKSYLYYIAYSLVGVVYVTVNMGIGKYHFFPDYLYFSEFRIFSGCYWYILLGIFLTHILDFKDSSPKIYRLLMTFQWTVTLLSFFSIGCLVYKQYQLIFLPSYITYLLFLVNIILLCMGTYRAYRSSHPRVNYVVVSFIPHIVWGLNMILIVFKITDLELSKNWICQIILYEMLLFGWVLIHDYLDSFRKVQLLQEKVIYEEKNATFMIEQTRIQERRSMAEILHDKVGIDIARMIHLLEMKNYSEVTESVKTLGSYIRNLSHRVLPVSLEMGAVSAALNEQITNMDQEIVGTEIRFASFDFPEQIESNKAFSLYLMTMELIQNAFKHAEAAQITVELYYYPDKIVLSCTDDGKGMPDPIRFGYGLSSIKKRSTDAGGEFSISSDSDSGTCVIIDLPH